MPADVDHGYLHRLRLMGYVEATSTLLLFGIAMPLKYFADMPLAVTVVGLIHGVLFLTLTAMFVTAVHRVPMPPRLAAWGIVAAVFPFGPFVVDRRLAQLAQTGA